VVEAPADQLMIEQSLAYRACTSCCWAGCRRSTASGRARSRWSSCWRAPPTGWCARSIVATSFTPEGDATAHYIAELLRARDPHLKITRLARGVPAGAELEYTDVNTIAQAMLDRRAA
jgi:recombination protein RecR